MTKWISISFAMLFIAATAMAGPGHDHGGEATPRGAGPTQPRFATHTELFEVVGIVEGEKLVLYVDRYESNGPVTNAKLEIESGSFKAVAQIDPERGVYSVVADPFKQPGSYPIQIVVSAGSDTDLLGADLVVADAHAGHEHGRDSSVLRHHAIETVAVATVMMLLGWLWIRRGRRGAA